MGAVVQRVLRDPEVRTVEHFRRRYEGLFGHSNPLIEVSADAGQIVAKSRISAVADTPTLETPDSMRIIDHQPMLMTPVPGVDPLFAQEILQLVLQFRTLRVELREWLMV